MCALDLNRSVCNVLSKDVMCWYLEFPFTTQAVVILFHNLHKKHGNAFENSRFLPKIKFDDPTV